MELGYYIGTDKVMLYLDGMDAFIDEEVMSKEGIYVQEEPYQVLPDSPEMDEVVYQENTENLVDTYDQFVVNEVFLYDE